MEPNNYFDATKIRQKKRQADVLKKNKDVEILAYELAESTHAHAELFFSEVEEDFQTDCKEGCSYCCHQPVTVFAFEAIQIASVLQKTCSPDELVRLSEQLKNRIENFKDASVEKNVNNKSPCPLLANNRCSIYEYRPLTCRLAHSFSVKKCQLSFEKDRTKAEIPMALELLTGVSGIIEGVYDGLPQKKLDGNLYELNSAVLEALQNPKAAREWANGVKDVFKNCIVDDT